MSWLRLDDGFTQHPKVLPLSNLAFRLHVVGLCYCARNLTDGNLAGVVVPMLLAEANRATRKHVKELVQAGLWREEAGGFVVNDFLEYNPSREETLAARESNKRRQALFRNRDLRDEVRARDRGCCRYCGSEVQWTDRRGPLGGTYDHVDPDGPNSLENLVVACRSCNSRKGDRTPSEADMPLTTVSKSVTKSDLSPGFKSGARFKLDSNNPPSRPVPDKDFAENNQGAEDGGFALEYATTRLLSTLKDADEDTPDVVRRMVRDGGLAVADVEWARECATGPGVRSPVRVAVAELRKRATGKEAA